MPTTKKATSNRFSRFKDPEFKKGIAPLATLQALIDDRGDEDQAGYFIKAENFQAAKWIAEESDFDEGAVLWNHTFKFSTGAREKGHFFIKPRLQILHRTNLLVMEQATKTIVGQLTDESMMKDDSGNLVPTKLEFDLDKQMVEEGKRQQRRYATKQMYCVFLLTNTGKRAHENPIVLTLNGINNVKFAQALGEHEKKMERALSMALDMDSAMKFDFRTKATFVFCPTLFPELQDNQYKTTNVAVKDVVEPDFTDIASIESGLEALMLEEADQDATFKLLDDPFLKDYVNRFTKQEAEKMLALGKAGYGMAEGVTITLAGSDGQVRQLPAQQTLPDTGENASL